MQHDGNPPARHHRGSHILLGAHFPQHATQVGSLLIVRTHNRGQKGGQAVSSCRGGRERRGGRGKSFWSLAWPAGGAGSKWHGQAVKEAGSSRERQ